MNNLIKKITFSIAILGFWLNGDAQVDMPLNIKFKSCNFLEVSGGESNIIGIRTDGSLWASGNNHVGQLGNGKTASSKKLIQISAQNDWHKIETGWYHSLALKNNGTLWAWGRNIVGECGIGNKSITRSITQIGLDSNWSSISCGIVESMAIKNDGTLWAWGHNQWGELGLGNTNNYLTPQQVGSDSNWKYISTGMSSFGIKNNGTLWAWGLNDYGQLGLNNTTNFTTPQQVGSDSNWLLVKSGGTMTVAIKNDGTIWRWGGWSWNKGLVGSKHPVQIGTDSNWLEVNLGKTHLSFGGNGSINNTVIGIKKDSSLWVLENNSNFIKLNSFLETKNAIVFGTNDKFLITDSKNQLVGGGRYWEFLMDTINHKKLTTSVTLTACTSLKLTSKNKKYSSYKWSTGDTTLSSTIAQSGLVTLRETDSKGCVNIDSVYVRIIKDEVSTAPDTSLCNVKANDTLKLNLSNWFKNSDFYFYDKAKIQTQTADMFIKNSASKKWTGFASPKNQTSLKCPVSGMVYPSVVYTNLLSKTTDTLITTRSLIKPVINDKKYTKYQWSNGDSTFTTSFNASGIYWFKQTDSVGCYQIDTFNFSRLNLYLAPRKIAKLGSSFVVAVKDSLNTNSQVVWSNGDTGWSTVYTVTKNTDTLYATQSDAYRSVTKFMVITGKAEAIKVSQEDQNKKNDLQDSLLANQNLTSTNGNKLSSDSLSQTQSGNIQIYPNPVSDVLFIEGIDCDISKSNQLINCRYEIFNSTGQLVQKGNISSTISVINLITGSYTLKIGNSSFKFIKK
jgi:alpha-tubulin suppressor-like RCC1 family protein